MFINDLTTFHTVVTTGSIRKASLELGVATSSVSRKIAVLEQQFGTPLFDRSAAGVNLTHAGRLFADYARSAVLDYRSLRADLNDLRGMRRRLIHVVAVESFSMGRPIEATTRFRRKFEGVSFRFSVLPAPQVPDVVARGDCDIGLAFCPPPNSGISILTKVNEPITVAVQPEHPLAAQASVSLRELAEHPVALPDVGFHVRALFDRACAAADVQIVPTLASNSFESLRDFVRSGGGLAVLPRGAVARDARLGHLIALPISVPSLCETTIDVIVRKRRLARVVSLFAEELCAAIAER
jgi:DNA-binding transcriptional LysR family regulator